MSIGRAVLEAQIPWPGILRANVERRDQYANLNAHLLTVM
jgi:hypothetical protein